MNRVAWCLLAAGFGVPGVLPAQDSVPRRRDVTLQDVQRATWRRATVHYGKWLTAGAAATFTAMAAHEHRRSRRDWNALLAICDSANEACLLGPDGRYLRSDAETLYQRALHYDARANRRLLGAQASVLVTAALFILDLRGGHGEPENIPLAPVRVTLEPTADGAVVRMRIAF